MQERRQYHRRARGRYLPPDQQRSAPASREPAANQRPATSRREAPIPQRGAGREDAQERPRSRDALPSRQPGRRQTDDRVPDRSVLTAAETDPGPPQAQ
jgi:hypothetical protein